MIKNQIGLEGDVTPPQFMSEIEARVYAAMELKTLFDRGPLKIERRWNRRFAHPEYHVTLKIPFARARRFWDPAYDVFPTGRPAKLLVVGSVPMSKGGWHARGGTVYYDIRDNTPRPVPCLGYENPINLANYPTAKSSCR